MTTDGLNELRSSWDAETLDRIDRKISQLARVVASRADLDALRNSVEALAADVVVTFDTVNTKLDAVLARLEELSP